MSRGFPILPNNFIINCREPFICALCSVKSHQRKERIIYIHLEVTHHMPGKKVLQHCFNTLSSTPVIKRKLVHIKKSSFRKFTGCPCSPFFISVQSLQPLEALTPISMAFAPKHLPSHFGTELWQGLYMETMKCNCETDTFDKLTDNLCTVSGLTNRSLISQGSS